MRFVTELTCHECGASYPLLASYVCTECMGPLEVSYDYDAVRKVMTRQLIVARAPAPAFERPRSSARTPR